MLKKLNRLSVVLLSTLATCVTYAAVSANNATAPQFYSEDNSSILVSPGHPEFTIKLKSNPTTGYSWFLRDYNKDLIKPVKHNFEASKEKLIGASGFEMWTFRAKPAAFAVPQQTTIKLIYARPWKGADGSTPIVFRVTTQGK